MKQQKINLLITSGGGFQGLTLIKLAKMCQQINIFMVDCYGDNVCRHLVDYFFIVPRIESQSQFLRELEIISKKYLIDYIVPSTDYELMLLSSYKNEINSWGPQVLVSSIECLKIFENKKRVNEWFIQNDIPTLPLLHPSTSKTWPLFGKTTSGWGSKNTIVLHSIEKYNQMTEYQKENYIWQKYLSKFNEYSVDFCFDINGKPSDYVIRTRDKVSSGFSVISTDKTNKQNLKPLVQKIITCLSHTGAIGFFNVQILENSRSFFVSDINPRVGTSAVFAIGKGINLFDNIFMSKDQKINSKNQSKLALTMIRTLEEIWVPKLVDSSIAGFIFDLDDTILDHKKWIFMKMHETGIQLNKKMKINIKRWDENVYILLEDGNKISILDEMIKLHKINEKLKPEIIEMYRSIIPPRYEVLYPDVENTLIKLKKNNFKIGILTESSIRSYHEKSMCLKLDDLWDAVLCTGELNSSKLQEMPFLKISEMLKVSPKQLAMVGDHIIRDMVASQKVGFHTSFHLQRKGAFHQANSQIYDKIYKKNNNIVPIHSLRELIWTMNSND